MKSTFEYKGITFYEGTPLSLCDLLITLNKTRERIVLDYGDVNTKQSWNETFDITGYIGKSTGVKPILLLVHNSRSMGGVSIMTDCILSIRSSKGKHLKYILK